MKCFSPITIKNPAKMPSSLMSTVPCGRCYACRMNRRVDWAIRLDSELQQSRSAYFITLTYDELSVPTIYKNQSVYYVLRKKDLQDLFKIVRKVSQFRYFAVGEYGIKFDRPHYHILFFDLSEKGVNEIYSKWKKGLVHVGKVESASIHYMTKDMMKDASKNKVGNIKGFYLMSKKPALGSKRLEKIKSLKKRNKDFTVNYQGFNHRMPRYYQDKIFNKDEKIKHNADIEELLIQIDRKQKQNMFDRGITDELEQIRYIEKERRSDERQLYKKLKKSQKL